MVPTRFGRVFTHATAGTRPTLLFLHDHPARSADWRMVIAHLSGRSTLTLDLPGVGLSETNQRTDSPSDQADIVEQVVLSHGVDRLIVVAHDTGAAVTSELMVRDMAGQLSFRLEKVVLSNGRVTGSPAGRAGFRWSSLYTRLKTGLSWIAGRGHDDRCAAQDERPTGCWVALRDWPKPIGLVWGPPNPEDRSMLGELLALRPAATVRRLPDRGRRPQDADRFAAVLTEMC